jgi:HPt (histidine-containing phosphotransfer) domain-containing protein
VPWGKLMFCAMLDDHLAHAPRLDSATAIANLGGDEDLYAEVVRIFLGDAMSQLASFDSALASGDFPVARRAAYTVKGIAASVGAERLHYRAHALEQACANADPERIAATELPFRAELTETIALLRDYLSG